MSTYGFNDLPETERLVKLTREELFDSTDLEEDQKVLISRALDFTEVMNLSIFFCPAFPCLYVTDNEIFSEIIGVDHQKLVTMVSILEFMHAQFCANNRPSKIAQLERRVKALEKQFPRQQNPPVSEEEYQHYLLKFKEKLPWFEAANISLVIDEENRIVHYKNNGSSGTRSSPRTYDISEAGYNKARRAANIYHPDSKSKARARKNSNKSGTPQ